MRAISIHWTEKFAAAASSASAVAPPRPVRRIASAVAERAIIPYQHYNEKKSKEKERGDREKGRERERDRRGQIIRKCMNPVVVLKQT